MAETKVINLEVKDNSEEAAKGFQKVADSIEDVNDGVKDTNKGVEEVGKTTDNITGGMVSKFKGLLGSVKSVISSFGILKTAIIATGIGALLVAIVAVKNAFTSSEEGQNRYAKLLSKIGVVVGNVTDILSNLGNSIISLSKAIGLVLVGDIDGAKQAFKEFKEEIFAVKDAVANFGEETRREIAQAGKIADARAKADRLERKLIVERAEADRKRAELLEKSQQRQNFSVKERIEFLKQASQLEEEITNKEIQVAKLRSEALIEENKLSNSNKEALQAEEESKARLIELETARLSKQKEVTGQISGLIEQEKALNKAAFDEKQRLIDENLAKEKLANEESLKLAKEKAQKEREIADAQYDLLQELRNTDQEQEIYELTKSYDAKFELAMGNFELEKALEEKQKEELAAINQKYIDIENEQNAKQKAKEDELNAKKLADEKQLQDAKFEAVSNTLSAIGNLAELFAGKSRKQQERAFKIQKAANIASATIDTYKAATGAYASLAAIPLVGPALGAIAAGAAITAGLLNVKNITSQKFDAGSASGGGGSAPSIGGGSTPQSIQPSFNIVGDSGVNQLEALKSQPSKAYVVSGEVSSAQALDRNRQRNATL